MWRTVFIAVGIMAIIIGVECLVIDSANLYAAGETKATTFINPTDNPAGHAKIWRPKEWMPWCLLSVGTITVIYAFLLPRRWHGAAG